MDVIGQTLGVFEAIAKAFAPGMEQLGVSWVAFWLVFFLSYVLIYSLLNFVHFLKDNPNGKLIVAIVMSFIISSNSWALAIIASVFPSLGVLLAIGLGVLILLALFVPSVLKEKSRFIGYLAFGFVFIYIAATILTSQNILSMRGTEGFVGMIEQYIGVIITVFIVISLLVFLKGGSGSGGSKETLIDKLMAPIGGNK